MTSIATAGLGAAYLVYVLTISNARPTWWRRFQYWWGRAAPEGWDGKPFACPVCMSLWCSLLFWTLAAGAGLDWVGFVVGWWAAAGVCLLGVQLMGWLRK